ncbi:MAG: TadE/TadG family type IV pilus assembly protein, partial [Kiritimatiellota bacterium]|nr:TadE/TadG family type IV pilus assembly protein [Kiritimatiellota bacterium]
MTKSQAAEAVQAAALAGDTEEMAMMKPDDRRRTTDDGRQTAHRAGRGVNLFCTLRDLSRLLRDAGFPQSAIGNQKLKILPAGQAMVEFMVGLVVVLVLLAGLIQIGQLTHAHTRTMIAARAAAGLLAMAPTPPVSETASLISDWVPGPDLRRHTHDDVAMVTSNAATLSAELVTNACLAQVRDAPVNALSTLRDSPNPAGDFFLVKGEVSE